MCFLHRCLVVGDPPSRTLYGDRYSRRSSVHPPSMLLQDVHRDKPVLRLFRAASYDGNKELLHCQIPHPF